MTYPAGASQGARQVVCLERITGIVAVTARLPLRGAGVPPVCRRTLCPVQNLETVVSHVCAELIANARMGCEVGSRS